MPTFSVNAVNGINNWPVKVEFHLGGKFRGFTSDKKNDPLIVEISQSGKYNWHARKNGEVVQRGESRGGLILVVI